MGTTSDSPDSFYSSLEKFLIAGNCPWGQNLDSLNEIVASNFNYTDDRNNDVTKIVWRNYSKSKIDLAALKNGRPIIEQLDEIFNSNPTIQFQKIP
jgi:hypothetical protein